MLTKRTIQYTSDQSACQETLFFAFYIDWFGSLSFFREPPRPSRGSLGEQTNLREAILKNVFDYFETYLNISSSHVNRCRMFHLHSASYSSVPNKRPPPCLLFFGNFIPQTLVGPLRLSIFANFHLINCKIFRYSRRSRSITRTLRGTLKSQLYREFVASSAFIKVY